MALTLSVAGLMNQPVGSSFTEEALWREIPLTVHVINQGEWLEVQIRGEAVYGDACARCGSETTETKPLEATFRCQSEVREEEQDEGVYLIDRHGRIDLERMTEEAYELLRPPLMHCRACSNMHDTYVVE